MDYKVAAWMTFGDVLMTQMKPASKYYFAGSQRVAVGKDGALTYLLVDQLGSTSLAVDASGVKTSEMRYKPWGEVRYESPSGSLPTDYTYTGQRRYTDSFGLMYYGARWYDPYLNHFTQPDTIIPDPYNSADYDRYSYARNNPVKYTDPSGHRVTPGCGDGRESCGASEKENAQAEYQRQRGNGLKCQGGNKTYCSYTENHPVETVASGLGAVVGAAVVEAFVLGGGAANLAYGAGVACLSNPICATIVGASAGKTAENADSLPRPVYDAGTEAHVYARHIAQDAFLNKSKFIPGEGGQAFADEVFDLATNVVPQSDGFVRIYSDLGRVVGTRGETWGRIVIDSSSGWVKTQFPQFSPGP